MELTIGVLALQGAFEEHQRSLESISKSIRTVQIRTPDQLVDIDGIILPGGESTAMGLIGGATAGLWDALRDFVHGGEDLDGNSSRNSNNINNNKPTWGTCAGMILLAERCVGTSAVITNGQSLIGGMDVLVCRNYFGSQISSFEMDTPPPPRPPHDDTLLEMMNKLELGNSNNNNNKMELDNNEVNISDTPFPGVFIRAPAILSAGSGVQILGKVVATPCKAAAVVLRELERKIAAGENVVTMDVVDALERNASGGISYVSGSKTLVDLPGASCDESNAREVICAVRKGQILCTAFHPEIVDDLRWHQYFVGMVIEAKAQRCC
jgi:5'-phosphate synthase pdxT subunit